MWNNGKSGRNHTCIARPMFWNWGGSYGAVFGGLGLDSDMGHGCCLEAGTPAGGLHNCQLAPAVMITLSYCVAWGGDRTEEREVVAGIGGTGLAATCPSPVTGWDRTRCQCGQGHKLAARGSDRFAWTSLYLAQHPAPGKLSSTYGREVTGEARYLSSFSLASITHYQLDVGLSKHSRKIREQTPQSPGLVEGGGLIASSSSSQNIVLSNKIPGSIKK